MYYIFRQTIMMLMALCFLISSFDSGVSAQEKQPAAAVLTPEKSDANVVPDTKPVEKKQKPKVTKKKRVARSIKKQEKKPEVVPTKIIPIVPDKPSIAIPLARIESADSVSDSPVQQDDDVTETKMVEERNSFLSLIPELVRENVELLLNAEKEQQANELPVEVIAEPVVEPKTVPQYMPNWVETDSLYRHQQTEAVKPKIKLSTEKKAKPARKQPKTKKLQTIQENPLIIPNWGTSFYIATVRKSSGLVWTIILLMLLFFVSFVLRKTRKLFSNQGFLPRILAILHFLVKASAVFLVLTTFLRLLPKNTSSITAWIMIGAAIGLGWSMKDFLPDLLARFVLSVERRVQKGIWVSGENFSGTVEHIGVRATWIRDANGNRVAVPNRELLNQPLLSDESGNKQAEVSILLPDQNLVDVSIRQLLTDSVLASPWIYPGSDILVLRDPDKPRLWRVQARLLETQFAQRFRGELLERFEAMVESCEVEPVSDVPEVVAASSDSDNDA